MSSSTTDAEMSLAHPPPEGGSSPKDSETIAEVHAKTQIEQPHPEFLKLATPEEKAKAEQEKEAGNKLFAMNKFALARDAYTKAIELDPHNPVFFSNRAQCDMKLEEYGSALIDADKAIELDRTFVKAYYRRGAAHLALGKYKEARLDFKTVTKLKPHDKDAQTKLKDCEKAIYTAAFAKAIAGEATKPASETALGKIQDMIIEDSYQGPRYVSGAVDLAFVNGLIEHYKNQKRLPRKYVYEILLDMIKLFKTLPTLLDIEIAPEKKFTVCGDVHGQFYDVCNIFQLNGMPGPENPYLFNGDFVDRGSFSIEVIMLFFSFKLLYPTSFHMLRGNHETINMNTVYGFQGEVHAKVETPVFELFTEAFNLIPLAACLQKKVLVVHGGLFSQDDVTLDQIRAIDRNQQPPESGLMTELLWSDPQKQRGRAPSKRGVGLSFGPDVTAAFLKNNDLELIIRSHEVKEDGYEIEHNGQLITVFSAPNYCDQMGNQGAYIVFNGTDMKPKCTSFKHVPHPNIQPMAYANGSQ